MNINVKGLVIGAGILLLWGLIGGMSGATAAVGPLIWLAVGLAPSYYLANVSGIAGYVATLVIIYTWQASMLVGA